MTGTQIYQALKDIKLTTVRKAISKACYDRSVLQTFGWYLFDLALYVGLMWGVFASDAWWAKLLFGLGTGCAVAFMFVWAHDAAHGALFKSDLTAEILGTSLMLPSLNMYRLWCHGHNRVHHGFTSYTPVDWIWRPLSPGEYAALPWHRRMLYRLERTPYGCALHYLLKVWWPGMVMYRPEKESRERLGYSLNKLITVAFALILSVASYRWGGGILGVIAAVVLQFIVFNYFIALFVYLPPHPSRGAVLRSPRGVEQHHRASLLQHRVALLQAERVAGAQHHDSHSASCGAPDSLLSAQGSLRRPAEGIRPVPARIPVPVDHGVGPSFTAASCTISRAGPGTVSAKRGT